MNARAKTGIAFITPHFIGFLILYLMPFAISVVLSLQRRTLFWGALSLDNYRAVLASRAFALAVRNNAIFMLVAILAIMFISFILSYALYSIRAEKWLTLAFVLPICIPSAAVIGFFRNLFSVGYSSVLDGVFGMLVVVLLFIWKNIGYNILIFLAGFSNIPVAHYESAEIDGAGKLQILRYIVFPQMLSTIGFALIVSILNSYKVFKETYLLQGNYPAQNIYMLQNYLNNKVMKFEIGELTAASNLFLLLLLLLFGLIYSFYWLCKRKGQFGD